VEHGKPGGAAHTVLVAIGDEDPAEQQQRHDALDRDRGEEDAAHDAAHVGRAVALRLGRRRHACAHRQLAGEREADEHRDDHDPEPAELDEQEDHDEPESAPVRRGVEGREARHAQRRRRREQRVDEARALPRRRRDGQPEEQRADGECAGEAQHDRLGRSETAPRGRSADHER